jgi:hypothetical protein
MASQACIARQGSDRDYVRKAKRLAARSDPIRQVPKSLPVSNRACSPLYLLALKLNGSRAYGLRDVAVPLNLGTFPAQIGWHQHNRRDPSNIWLRDLLEAVTCGERHDERVGRGARNWQHPELPLPSG